MAQKHIPTLKGLGASLRFRTMPLNAPGFQSERLEVFDKHSFDVVSSLVSILDVSVEPGLDSIPTGARAPVPQSLYLKAESPVLSHTSSGSSTAIHRGSPEPSERHDHLEPAVLPSRSSTPPAQGSKPGAAQATSYTFENVPLHTPGGWGWTNLMKAAFPGDEDTISLLKVSYAMLVWLIPDST